MAIAGNNMPARGAEDARDLAGIADRYSDLESFVDAVRDHATLARFARANAMIDEADERDEAAFLLAVEHLTGAADKLFDAYHGREPLRSVP